jgi:cytosine/adenosine deaminase-related metal-dependent hydrolase
VTSAGARDRDDLARPQSFSEESPAPVRSLRIVVAGAWVAGAPRGRTVVVVEEDGTVRTEPAGRREPLAGQDFASRCVALPAFADAHAHLELSSIRGEDLPRGSFADWIERLIRERRAVGGAGAFESAVLAGASELLQHGCSAVGDIDSTGAAVAVLVGTPLEGVIFREWIGRPDAAALMAGTASLAELAEASALRGMKRWRIGISPHAPFSTAPDLYQAAFRLARDRGLPVASHVAESRDEQDYLRDRSGPLADLFERLKFDAAGARLHSVSAFEQLRQLDPPRGFLVIHGNLLEPAELEACARNGWPLVHCPRSREFFDHPRPLLGEAKRRGVVLAMGTDSRASNGSLDPWQELMTWRRLERELDDVDLFDAATAGGRLALQLAPAALRDGEPATFQLAEPLAGGPIAPDEILAAAVRGGLRTVALFIRGRLAWQAAPLPPIGGVASSPDRG